MLEISLGAAFLNLKHSLEGEGRVGVFGYIYRIVTSVVPRQLFGW